MANDTPPDSASNPTNSAQDPEWERGLLKNFAFAALQEQRRARRWGIFFKILVFVYLFAVLIASWSGLRGSSWLGKGKITALVEVKATQR